MTTDRDPRTRIVLSWLREEAHENPEGMLLRALDEVDATPQRRSWRPAWRSDSMNTYANLILVAAAVLVVAVVGYQFLPTRSGGSGAQPTIAPSPSPALLARGSFTAHGIAAELDATGSGADVAGTLSLSDPATSGRATVDLGCARTTKEGLIEIGGRITDSTFNADDQVWHDGFPKGQSVVVIFEPGSPVNAIWFVTHADDAPVASCAALFESMDSSGDQFLPGTPGLDPINGTVEFGS